MQDMLVSLESQYHLIRMCKNSEDVFIYVVISREKGNLDWPGVKLTRSTRNS